MPPARLAAAITLGAVVGLLLLGLLVGLAEGDEMRDRCVRQCLSSRPRTQALVRACRESCAPRPQAPQSAPGGV